MSLTKEQNNAITMIATAVVTSIYMLVCITAIFMPVIGPVDDTVGMGIILRAAFVGWMACLTGIVIFNNLSNKQ